MCDGEQGREGGAAEGVKEGGERASDLVDALERDRMAVAATARLQEERTTLNERITLLTNETSRLETRLEHTTPQMELAGVGAETSTLTGGGVIFGTVGTDPSSSEDIGLGCGVCLPLIFVQRSRRSSCMKLRLHLPLFSSR